MAYLSRSYNKQTGVTYVYEAESYWVPGVGARSRRKLIGKIDPETGDIVPTGKRGRHKDENPLVDYAPADQELLKVKGQLLNKTYELMEAQSVIKAQKKQIEILKGCLLKIEKICDLMECTVASVRSEYNEFEEEINNA